MENLCVLTQKEKLELESIAEILLSVHLDFESATNPDKDNDNLCQSVEEVIQYEVFRESRRCFA